MALCYGTLMSSGTTAFVLSGNSPLLEPFQRGLALLGANQGESADGGRRHDTE
jgi:CHASE3 domain sensor protein